MFNIFCRILIRLTNFKEWGPSRIGYCCFITFKMARDLTGTNLKKSFGQIKFVYNPFKKSDAKSSWEKNAQLHLCIFDFYRRTACLQTTWLFNVIQTHERNVMKNKMAIS